MPSPRLDLLVVADHFRGGLGAAAQAHARWFAGRGWSVALAAAAPVAEEIAPAEAVDVAVPAGAADVRGMVAAARQLRAVLRRRRPRFVHAHGTRSQMLTLLAGRVPYVTMHGAGRVEGQGALGAAVRRTARLLASWLAVRAYSASPAPGRWRTTLHASPSLSGLDRLAASEMADEPTLLWVGRMDAPKRPELFVEACAAAADDLPLRGVMLGGGPRLEEMRALAARLRAPVDVVGESPDVAAHLAARGRQDRQHLRERQRRPDPEDLQPCLAGRCPDLLVQRERQPLVPLDLLEAAEVDRPGLRRVVLLVGLREALGVRANQAAALLLAVRRDHRRAEVVAPGAGCLGAPAFEVGDVRLADLLALGRAYDEVQPGRERLPHVRGVLDPVPGELLLEDRRDPLAHGRVVAVARQVDEAGEEPAVDVAAHEQLQLAPLAGVHHLRGDRHQVLDRRLEQLVARVGLEHVHQGLARVAHRVQADGVDHLGGLLAQHRDPSYGLGVGGRGEQPQEPALADDLTLLVELLHAHVVQVHGAVHGRPRVGLRQDEQVLVAGPRGHCLGKHPRRRRVSAQDPETGAGTATSVSVPPSPRARTRGSRGR